MSQYNRQPPNGKNQYGITESDMSELRHDLDEINMFTCVGCGCTSNNPCFKEISETRGQSCSWLRKDSGMKLGVCSFCKERIDEWDSEATKVGHKPQGG